jgi:ABC-type hemin transport system substrate-binding protein
MKIRALVRLLALGGFLLSAYNYCPPGAQAATTQIDDCCHPTKTKDKANKRSCCTQERIASAQDHSKLSAAPLQVLLYIVRLNVAVPQVAAHRLARSLIRPVGPPGFSPAALGLRAPPLA